MLLSNYVPKLLGSWQSLISVAEYAALGIQQDFERLVPSQLPHIDLEVERDVLAALHHLSIIVLRYR